MAYGVNRRALSPSQRGRLGCGRSLGADGHLGKLSVFPPGNGALQALLWSRLEGCWKEESASLPLGVVGLGHLQGIIGLHGGHNSLPTSAQMAPEEKPPSLSAVPLEGVNPGSKVPPGPV